MAQGALLLAVLLRRPRGAVHAHRLCLQSSHPRRSAGCATAGRSCPLLSGLVLIVMGVLLLTGELAAPAIQAQQALDSIGLNVFKDL